MIKKTVVSAARGLLTKLLERLNREEVKTTPRGTRKAWYQMEYHFPPSVVAVTSAVFLFFVMIFGLELTGGQITCYGAFVVVLVALFSYYLKVDHPRLAQNDEAMALLAVIFFLTLFFIKAAAMATLHTKFVTPYLVPLSLASLLTALLLSPRLAIVMAFVGPMLAGLMSHFSLELALVGSVGSVTAVALGQRARTAHHVVRTGLFVGLMQSLTLGFLMVVAPADHKTNWISLAGAFLSGNLASVIALGVLPYLEGFFSRLSNLRLLELCDVNHPLLRRMSLEAPGTYHHSLVVASLAENAANAIGANGLLCRVGAYFHDIGKMVKAEYFIENQGTIGNPHDQVSPSLSRLIITSHVKEGVALGLEHKLDAQVIDFIPQHHGTSKIEYFYHKALTQEATEEEFEKEEVSAESYRYPGPKPQSRETGIVMLADSVEAAARTIEDPTHQRYKDLVYKIINKKLFDEQLNETALTLKDLHTIAERFVATLQSVHHSRIPYPEAVSLPDVADEEKLSPPES